MSYTKFESFTKDKYWKCPRCGCCFKDNAAVRCSKGILISTSKMVTHLGFRMAGGTLGVTIGKIDIGSRIGGQVATYLCGNINDIDFIPDRKCPHCGHIVKNKP